METKGTLANLLAFVLLEMTFGHVRDVLRCESGGELFDGAFAFSPNPREFIATIVETPSCAAARSSIRKYFMGQRLKIKLQSFDDR
jgi:hypothetical protein